MINLKFPIKNFLNLFFQIGYYYQITYTFIDFYIFFY